MPEPLSDASVERWIARLNAGDPAALERLMTLYEPYVRILVRRRLGARLRSKVESRDIAQSVMADAVLGFRRGGLRFEGRAQLLGYFRRIALRRLADRYQKHRRSLEHEQPLGDSLVRDHPADAQPRPSEVAQGREFWERLMRSCPPTHRDIVRLRMSGTPLAEIARQTGLHEGSVRRILYDLARRMAIAPRRPMRGDEPEDLSRDEP
jgi:RNA polymerase sigma-70 factor (ECF subfamily)